MATATSQTISRTVRRGTARSLRIVSNLPVLPHSLEHGEALNNRFLPVGSRPISAALLFCWVARGADAIVLHVPDRELLAICGLKLVCPFLVPRLVGVDVILTQPGTSLIQRLINALKRLLLKQVDLFLLHQKDVSGMQASYGIDPRRTRYIPYKVNAWNAVQTMDVPEGSYVFSGGRSRRDYDTFCTAMADLEVPTLLLTPRPKENAVHETYFRGDAPSHVRILHDDGSAESWLDHMANARIVVIPVSANSISPSGVGTYLLAMAMGKCVIMTESPATRDVIEHEREAVLVPVGDAPALRRAIDRVWHDRAYRESIATRGREYAMSLGGVENLQRNIAEAVADFLAPTRAASEHTP